MPRSLSPAPVSSSVTVETSVGKVSIKTRVLRHLWLWAAPLLLSALGTAFGYVRGYAKGLSDAAERLARIETRATALGVRVATVEERTEATENGLATETRSARAERATALEHYQSLTEDLEKIKKSVPRIEGLPKKP